MKTDEKHIDSVSPLPTLSVAVPFLGIVESNVLNNTKNRAISDLGGSRKVDCGPLTREAYEKAQSVLRHMFDPLSGRTRLIKGDGEVMEEIVSRSQHRAINKAATAWDGYVFQRGGL
jgi:hypothetical protein